MGIEKNLALADPLFDRVVQRVLGILFTRTGESFSVSELIRQAGSGSGAVQRLLAKLTAVHLVTVENVGNQKRYRANTGSPIYAELRGIVEKSFGLAGPLQGALQPLSRRITAAFIFGSIAKGYDTAKSDVDLLVVSDKVSYTTLYETLLPVEAVLARSVNPRVMKRDEWRRKLMSDNAFVRKIAAQPKIFLIGSEADLA